MEMTTSRTTNHVRYLVMRSKQYKMLYKTRLHYVARFIMHTGDHWAQACGK